MRRLTAMIALALVLPVLPAMAATDLPDPLGAAAPDPSPPTAAPEPATAAPAMPDTRVQKSPKHHAMTHRNAPVPNRLRAKKTAKKAPVVNQLKVAERAGFKKVSDLVAFPPFFPGLGIVTVKPETLPVGPFRTFDRKGKLIATVYMLPLKDMDEHKKWDEVKGLPAPADHATFYFHPGHPGVEMPHYHLVIWHVSRKNEDLVAK